MNHWSGSFSSDIFHPRHVVVRWSWSAEVDVCEPHTVSMVLRHNLSEFRVPHRSFAIKCFLIEVVRNSLPAAASDGVVPSLSVA